MYATDMEASSFVSVEEYLSATYKPSCEYLDGVLRQKSMPRWDHGAIQGYLCQLINDHFARFAAATEITVRISATRFLVPDIVVQRRADLQRPYPMKPVHLVIEVLSPDDRMSDTIAKCEAYHACGVPFCWIIDPEAQTGWDYPCRSTAISNPHRGMVLWPDPLRLHRAMCLPFSWSVSRPRVTRELVH